LRALKARNITAQGAGRKAAEALGAWDNGVKAQQGRSKQAVPPLQGFTLISSWHPGLFCPAPSALWQSGLA